MTALGILYRQRADEAREGAAEATLMNVRERWLVSEASWAQLALRCERAAASQEELIVRKAGERAALRALAQS